MYTHVHVGVSLKWTCDQKNGILVHCTSRICIVGIDWMIMLYTCRHCSLHGICINVHQYLLPHVFDIYEYAEN